MPTINIATTSGTVSNQGSVYSTVHGATTGSAISVNPTTALIGQVQTGGTYHIYRAFLAFNTSAITTNPASATLNIFITTIDTASYLVQIGTAPSLVTNIATTDFAAYTTNYSGIFTVTAGWNTITLNSTALVNLNALTTFDVAIIGLNDINSIAPTGISETDTLGFSTNIPYISYVLGGYTHKIESIVTMGKVNGVLRSAITKLDKV